MAEGIKIIDNNKKAYFDFFIEDTYEAGISLVGCEALFIILIDLYQKNHPRLSLG